MIKKYKDFINESLRDKMVPISNNVLKNKLDHLSVPEKIGYIQKYDLSDDIISEYKEEIINYLNKIDIATIQEVSQIDLSDNQIINTIENAIKKEDSKSAIKDIEKLINVKFPGTPLGVYINKSKWMDLPMISRRIILNNYIYAFLPDIPILKKNPSKDDVIIYLKRLYNSRYSYHIDDDPGDIDSFDEETQKILRNNSDIVWEFSYETGFDPWDYYGEVIGDDEDYDE